MTDYQLVEFARKAQADARRCYLNYLFWRDIWEGGDADCLYDVKVWQYRASVAAEHAVEMLAIVTR